MNIKRLLHYKAKLKPSLHLKSTKQNGTILLSDSSGQGRQDPCVDLGARIQQWTEADRAFVPRQQLCTGV